MIWDKITDAIWASTALIGAIACLVFIWTWQNNRYYYYDNQFRNEREVNDAKSEYAMEQLKRDCISPEAFTEDSSSNPEEVVE